MKAGFARAAQRRLVTAVLVASWTALLVSTVPLNAQAICPSSPASESTFASMLRSLISRTFGTGSLRPGGLSGMVVSQLDSKQKKELVDDLVKELSGQRVKATESRQAEEAEARLEQLKRDIGVRDQLERLGAQRGLRGRNAKGELRGIDDAKPLGKIIDEETKRAEPGLGAKYGPKYAQAIYTAIESDPNKFIEAMGTIAGGDYWGVMGQAMEWGAGGFSTVVGDVLEEAGLESTKKVWGVAVDNAGAAADIMRAVARGDHDAAWDRIKEEYKSKVKSSARSAASGIINWAASRGGATPSIAGMTPGDIYLSALDAEIQLIEWSKRFIREKSSIGDGECIRRYKSAHADNGGDASAAYEAFADCLPTSRFSSFFEFEKLCKEIGIDYTQATRDFLEANRLGQSDAWTPIEWIKARVEQHREQLEREMGPQLSKAEQILVNLGEAALSATNERLVDLAAAKLNEVQWDRIKSEIRELEQKIDATMAEVQNSLNRLRTNSDAIQQACNAYDTQKVAARDALAQGLDLSVAASQLLGRMNDVDVSACTGERQSPPDRAARDAISNRVKSLADSLEARLGQICSAAADIRGAASKEAARKRLDDTLAAAREVEGTVREVSAAADELQTMSAGMQAHADRSPRLRAAQNAIAAMRGEVNSIAGRFASLRDGKFLPAKNAMTRAVQQINGLAPATKELIEKTTNCLHPFADAPIAKGARDVLADLRERSTNVGGCQGEVNKSWYERDLDPPRGDGLGSSSSPWARRDLELTTPIGRLQAKLAELDGRCGAVPAQSELPAADIAADKALAASAKTRADGALQRMQKCVADAITAYNDTWLNPKISVSDVSCEPEKNEKMLGELRDAANAGSDKARATLAGFEPLASKVRAAHADYQAGVRALDASDFSGAEAKLTSAKTSLDQLGGKPSCPALAQQIASALDRIKRVKDASAKADEVIASCDLRRLTAARNELSKIGAPAQSLISLVDRAIQSITPTRASLEQARASFARGEIGGARTQAANASAAVANLPGCSDLSRTIDTLINQIDRLADALTAAESAIGRCDRPSIKESIARLSAVSNPAARSMLSRLRTADTDCAKRERERAVADARERCTGSFGPYSEPVPATVGREVKCTCSRGYAWTPDQKSCASEQDLAAARNEQCRQQFGNSYHAGPILRNGKFYCIPDKQTADAKCREANGPGVIAGRINADGSSTCIPDMAQGNTLCQQQYGRGSYALSRNANGTFQCQVAGRQPVPQQGHDPRASAAIIQAIGAAAAAIQRGQSSPPPARRCHHRPGASTQHCGSN